MTDKNLEGILSLSLISPPLPPVGVAVKGPSPVLPKIPGLAKDKDKDLQQLCSPISTSENVVASVGVGGLGVFRQLFTEESPKLGDIISLQDLLFTQSTVNSRFVVYANSVPTCEHDDIHNYFCSTLKSLGFLEYLKSLPYVVLFYAVNGTSPSMDNALPIIVPDDYGKFHVVAHGQLVSAMARTRYTFRQCMKVYADFARLLLRNNKEIITCHYREALSWARPPPPNYREISFDFADGCSSLTMEQMKYIYLLKKEQLATSSNTQQSPSLVLGSNLNSFS